MSDRGRELMHLRNRSGPVIRATSRSEERRSAIMEAMMEDVEDYVPHGDLLEDLDGPTEADLREIENDDLPVDPDDVLVPLDVEDLYADGDDD